MQKRTRGTTLLVLALALLISLLPQTALGSGYSVVVNGVPVAAATELRNGQLMVAVRPFVQAMGGTVTWNATARMATIAYRGSHLTIWLGNSLAFQDDQRIWSPVAPYLKENQFMIPGWWLAARLGAKVSFDGTTLSVSNGLTPAPVPTPASVPTISNPRPNSVLANPLYLFPFPAGAAYDAYYDTMGAARFWAGQQFGHEGTDIAAAKGTPIVAVASGTVVRYGWSILGGYRLTIQLDDHPGYRFYYAHLDRYAPGISLNTHVQTGQLLGYVGSTGEGPERTEGKFIDHLHFGIYVSDGSALNPYSLLKYWEGHKVTLP